MLLKSQQIRRLNKQSESVEPYHTADRILTIRSVFFINLKYGKEIQDKGSRFCERLHNDDCRLFPLFFRCRAFCRALWLCAGRNLRSGYGVPPSLGMAYRGCCIMYGYTSADNRFHHPGGEVRHQDAYLHDIAAALYAPCPYSLWI